MVKRKVIKKVSSRVKKPHVTVTYSGTPRHHKIEERFFYVMIVIAAFAIAFGGATYITGYQFFQCSAAPNVPGLLVSSTGNQKVVLSITPSQGQGQGPCPATSFKIFKATKSGGVCSSYSLALTTTSSTPTVSGLTNGVTYCFKAKGVESVTGNNYESGDSNEDYGTPQATVPSAPQNLIATAGINSVRLVWRAPSDNGGSAIGGYKISRGLNSGQYSDLSSVAAGTITYNDTTALVDTTYYYVVFANNTGVAGYGSPSNEVSGIPSAPPTASSSSTTTTTSPNATNTTDSSSTTTTLPPTTTTTRVVDTTTTTTLPPTTTTTQGVTEAEALSALEDAKATIAAYSKTKDVVLASALYNQATEAFNSQNYELTKTLSLQAKDSIKESESTSQQGPPIVLISIVVLIVIAVGVIAYFYFIKKKPTTAKLPPQQEPPSAPPAPPEEPGTEPSLGSQ